MKELEFYNPLNLVIDSKVRDVSEYFKNKFYEENLNLNEIDNYIKISKLTYEEIMLFYIRLLYPSYYFDTYDEIIKGNLKEEKLLLYINKNQEFEQFLKDVYIIINNYYRVPDIEWITKK